MFGSCRLARLVVTRSEHALLMRRERTYIFMKLSSERHFYRLKILLQEKKAGHSLQGNICISDNFTTKKRDLQLLRVDIAYHDINTTYSVACLHVNEGQIGRNSPMNSAVF